MKRILWLLAFISTTALADSGSDSAKAWIKNTLGNQTAIRILGQTAQGQPCGLFLTDKQNGVYSLNVSSLVPLASVEVATTAQTNITYDPTLIFFSGQHTVAVQLDESGSLKRAIGANGVLTIDCKFK